MGIFNSRSPVTEQIGADCDYRIRHAFAQYMHDSPMLVKSPLHSSLLKVH
jgi:hypothetical protein